VGFGVKPQTLKFSATKGRYRELKISLNSEKSGFAWPGKRQQIILKTKQNLITCYSKLDTRYPYLQPTPVGFGAKLQPLKLSATIIRHRKLKI